MKLIFGHSEALAKAAADEIPDIVGPNGFGLCQAIGVATGENPEDQLLAVCVYHDYHPEHKTCQVSIVSWSPKWAQRGVIKALLSVPFEQYGVNKLWSCTPHDNERALKFNKGIGFKREALLAHQFGKGRHAIITRMMASKYRAMYCN